MEASPLENQKRWGKKRRFRLEVGLPPGVYEALQALVSRGLFRSRSEAVRLAVQGMLQSYLPLLQGSLSGFKPRRPKGRPARILYMDHVLFRGKTHREVKPHIREALGWIVKEDDRAVWLVSDRPVDPDIEPKPEDGLLLLRNCIIQVKHLKEEV